jgi:hypothetical protein
MIVPQPLNNRAIAWMLASSGEHPETDRIAKQNPAARGRSERHLTPYHRRSEQRAGGCFLPTSSGNDAGEEKWKVLQSVVFFAARLVSASSTIEARSHRCSGVTIAA